MGVDTFWAFPVMRVFDTATQCFFNVRKTLCLDEPTAKPLKTCLKENGNFVAMKYKEFQFD